MSYNKDTDYQAKINEAVSTGDYESAAKYEQSRNEKIDSEGLNYEKTNRFSGWLDTTDYSNVLREQIKSGESASKVADTLKKRVRKSSGTEGLTRYAYDDVYDMAVKHIMGNSYSYEKSAPVYKNSYDSRLQNAYKKLLSVKEFDYDMENDELYKYYKAQYNREGKRAMEDLLGELAANTGGIASSYAVSAAAQSLDYYNRKLTDKIPELYEDAYKRYTDTISREERNFDMLYKLAEAEDERYVTALNQYNKDRELDYNAYMDGKELNFKKEEALREQAERDREYEYLYKKLENEAEENSRKLAQQESENSQKDKDDDIATALKKWDMLGYLDEESAEILGLPAGLHTVDYDYKQAQKYKLYNR